MKSRKLLLLASLLIPLCFVNLGCDLTIGPKTKTVYTLIHEGKPMEIVETVKVRARVLDAEAGDAVSQDIGGWIVMPPDHWAAVKRALETKGK